MMANGMMYLRILILAFLFNTAIATRLAIPFLFLFVLCGILSRLSYSKNNHNSQSDLIDSTVESHKNPLEFKTALLFGVLFILFALITDFVMKTYGNAGVASLAYVVGITDIDPFLLNLLQHKMGITEMTIGLAIINATNSNNILKMIYALSLSSKTINKKLIINFAILIISGLAASLLFYLA
jgi:uncharacterized membrane protein (DUF4010 family)